MPEFSCNDNQDFFALALDADVRRQAGDDTRVSAAPPLPEAPCSTNAFVDISGVRHQVTARGWTPAEMAATYQAAVTALQASYAPVQPSREQRLRGMLHCALVHAVSDDAGDLALARRLVKAANLVRAGAVRRTCADGIYAVQSQSTPDRHYIVDPVDDGSCDCVAAQQRPLTPCTHQWSVAFWRRLDEAA